MDLCEVPGEIHVNTTLAVQEREQLTPNHSVVLIGGQKYIRKKLALTSPEARNEINIYSSLQSALQKWPRSLPRFCYAYTDRTNNFILCQYIDGAHPLSEQAPSVQRFWAHLADLNRGLAFLHGNAMVHRNLKLSNVLIDTDGCAVLVDFGLSCTSFRCSVPDASQLDLYGAVVRKHVSTNEPVSLSAWMDADLWGALNLLVDWLCPGAGGQTSMLSAVAVARNASLHLERHLPVQDVQPITLLLYNCALLVFGEEEKVDREALGYALVRGGPLPE